MLSAPNPESIRGSGRLSGYLVVGLLVFGERQLDNLTTISPSARLTTVFYWFYPLT